MARYEKPNLGFIEDEDGAIKIDDIEIPPPPVAALSNDVPDTRLMITELIIKNFKSYAGERTLGPFDKNFTAVVGPNGSGKSNVIDALLFVFGYRAKKIRSKKVGLLIHKSDKYPDLTSCTVTVNFANIQDIDDKFIILPDSRFTISRTAFKDDTSHYEICNKRAPYKEVIRTLRAYGIDLEHSRFLILQGEIEAISLMTPKGEKDHESGMLEYVEDIIGSNRFIDPIQKFHEKVEILKEKQQEKMNILKLVEQEKDDLEEPKNKALEYLRMENKMHLLENSLLHLKRNSAETELQSAIKSKTKILDRMNALKKELEDTRLKKKSIESELDKVNSEFEMSSRIFEECKEQYKNCLREDAAYLENKKHAKHKREELERNLASVKNELDKLMKKLATFEKETGELQVMKKKLESEKEIEEKKMSEVMDSSKKESIVLQEKKDKLEVNLIELKNASYQIKSEMNLTFSELDIYQRTSKKEKEHLNDLVANNEKTIHNIKEEEKYLSEEENLISDTEKELNSLKQQLVNSKAREESLLEQLKASRVKYEEAKVSLHSSRHRSGMLQAFMKEKSSGRLAGVYGRLGDLGAIDEKYDIAISTACSQLDQIVTDTLVTAQQCVQFLKRNNLGYATFIPLDKMAKWIPYTQQRIFTPENVPRLFDLIHVKDKSVLPAFYYAIQDTLVAENLEQATRIGLQGKQRYRVVTLKGELIDLAGTMSGGGGRVLKGRMGQTIIECNFTSEDVAKMGEEVDMLSKNLSETKRLYLRLQENISDKSKKLSSLQLSVKKRKLRLDSYKENVQLVKLQIEEQKKKVAASTVDQNKIKMLEEQIEVKKKNFSVSTRETSELEQNISKLQEEIIKISKGKFSKLQKNVDQLNNKIHDVSQGITKSTVNINQSKRNIKKAEEKIRNIERNIEENKTLTLTLKDQLNALTVKAKAAIETQEKAEEALKLAKDKRAELKKQIDNINEEDHKLKLKEIELKNELKKYESCEAEKRSSIKHINMQFTKLKLNEVDGETPELPSLTPEEIEKLSFNNLTSNIEVLKVQLEDMHPDISSIKEYEKKEKLCEEKQKDLEDITKEKILQMSRYDELRKRRLSEFMKGFTAIAKKLKEIYQMLTLGGDAEMELVDSFDPFAKGIEFSVRPPRKSWKYMRNLSGGEKTLSSLALVFALHYYRPTPFYVMDEIDAALDVRNVAIVGYFLKEETKNTQFIIVSLRNIMNELSDHLIGIYKINNCSRHVSIGNVKQWKQETNANAVNVV